MGGALARPATVPDAISARDAAFCCLVIGMMAPPVAGLVPAAIDDVIGALAPWSTGRSMVNLHGTPGDDADRARAWTDGDLARLRRDKARYDPDNLFRFGHSVRPSSA
ncbi:MAG: BBE domain-containing protein [Nocardioidaceae bacterium]